MLALLVLLLVLLVVGFIRGLEKTLEISGDQGTALVFSLGMGENLEYSSIPMRSSELVAASVPGIREIRGKKFVSPELYLGTQVGVQDEVSGQTLETLGLVRGVTQAALLVREKIELESGSWPRTNEVMVGKLAAAKLGVREESLAIGKTLQLENREWKIAGFFSAGGSAFESEIWCRLDDLQQSMKRQDLSLVALKLAAEGDFSDIDLFCKQRLDLELQAMQEIDYYEMLQRDYQPVRWLAWLVVGLVGGSGIFAGLNTMYGAVVGRVQELAMLRTLGFGRRAIALSLVQEALILSVSASLIAAFLAIVLLNGIAIRFTMGAFQLEVDSQTVLVGCFAGLLLGMLGAIPPAIRALRIKIVEGLRAV